MTFPQQGMPQPGNPGGPGYYGAPQSPQGQNPQYGFSGQAPQNYPAGAPFPGYQGGFPVMPEPPRKKSKVGKIILSIGAVVILIGLILGGLSYFLWSSISFSDLKAVGAEEQVVTVSADSPKLVYFPVDAQDKSQWGCGIKAPDGIKPDLSIDGIEKVTLTLNGRSYSLVGQIGGKGRAEGDYVVHCTDPSYIVDSAIQGKIIGAIMCSAGSSIGIFLGAVIFIIGLIVWLVTRKN